MKRKSNSALLLNSFIILLSITGGVIAFYAMFWGPWAYSDSSSYISAARNFASGDGLVIIHSNGKVKTVTEFPPFFSIMLSFFGGEQFDLVSIIRILNSFLFTCSILLISSVLFKLTRDYLLSAVGGLFFLASPQIIRTYTSAMTEPLFITLLLLAILSILFLQESTKKVFPFLLVTVSCLLPVTRYAGLVFVGLLGIGVFYSLRNLELKTRFIKTFLYYLISFLPIGLWFIRLYSKFNKLGGKRFSIQFSLFISMAKSFLEELSIIRYWIPYFKIYENSKFSNLILIISIIFISMLLTLSIMFLFSKSKNNLKLHKANFLFILGMIIAYTIFIAFTHSITIPQIDIIDRMMVPLYPLIIIFSLFSIFAIINNSKFHKTLLILFLIVLIISLRFNFLLTNTYVKNMRSEGEGFTARIYQQSGIINEIKKIPVDKKTISNSAGFVLFHSNRYPIQVDNFPNYSFGTGDTYGEIPFREENASLILMYSDFSNYYGEKSNQLLSALTHNLNIVYQDNEGGIYSYK